jgi:mRNA interferase RelE/StbE
LSFQAQLNTSSKNYLYHCKKAYTKIDALAKNPRPSGMKKLEGEDNLYRIGVGDYHIIYQIEDDKLIVLVVKIGDRKEIYKK